MRKALIVGIDEYAPSPLNCCCRDAESMKEILSRNEDNSVNFIVKLEKNIKTKALLRQKIEQCFSGDADIALFYYSGHGYIDDIGGYLVTPDYSKYDYGVSLQDIMTIANKSDCRNKIIILDSCYSGTMGSFPTTEQKTAFISEGVTILTSSRATEESVEQNGHGLFTALLLEALSGCAADITGNITPGSLYAYIDKALSPWSQRPVFKTNTTRFVSLRNVKPLVDLEIIRNLKKYFCSEDMLFQLNPSFEPTNSPQDKHEVIHPYADEKNTKIFSELQKLESVGIVTPVGENHMYYAAMKNKSCKLTSIGKQYWRLVNKGLI